VNVARGETVLTLFHLLQFKFGSFTALA